MSTARRTISFFEGTQYASRRSSHSIVASPTCSRHGPAILAALPDSKYAVTHVQHTLALGMAGAKHAIDSLAIEWIDAITPAEIAVRGDGGDDDDDDDDDDGGAVVNPFLVPNATPPSQRVSMRSALND